MLASAKTPFFERDTLQESQTKTYELDGTSFETNVAFIGAVSQKPGQKPEVRFAVNGVLTNLLTVGEYDFAAGAFIAPLHITSTDKEKSVEFIIAKEDAVNVATLGKMPTTTKRIQVFRGGTYDVIVGANTITKDYVILATENGLTDKLRIGELAPIPNSDGDIVADALIIDITINDEQESVTFALIARDEELRISQDSVVSAGVETCGEDGKWYASSWDAFLGGVKKAKDPRICGQPGSPSPQAPLAPRAAPATLAEYPDFLFKDDKLDAVIVVGKNAPSTDVITAIDIAAQLTLSNDGALETGIAVLDTDVAFDEQNAIAVGSPCDNTYVARAIAHQLGYSDRKVYPAGMRACEYLQKTALPENAGVIALPTPEEHYTVLVTGMSTIETSWAGDLLANPVDLTCRGPPRIDPDHRLGRPCARDITGSFCTVEPTSSTTPGEGKHKFGKYYVSCQATWPEPRNATTTECPSVSESVRLYKKSTVYLKPGMDVVATPVWKDNAEPLTFSWDGSVMESYPEQYPITINGETHSLSERTRSITLPSGLILYLRVTKPSDTCESIGLQIRAEEPPANRIKVSINLDKGWNLITAPGKVLSFVPTGQDKLLGYVWLAEEKQYVTLKEARAVLKDRFQVYLATHAFWVYSYNDQELVMNIKPFNVDELEVAEGWNLLPIISPFNGKNLKTLSNGCELQSSYLWDSKNQRWSKWSLNALLSEDLVGEGILVKSKNACSLQGGILMPPSFPVESPPGTVTSPRVITPVYKGGGGAGGAATVKNLKGGRVHIVQHPSGTKVAIFNNPLWDEKRRTLIKEMIVSLEKEDVISIDEEGVITVNEEEDEQ
ncbi:hypothetical protein D6783_00210 [Candidatus Woesearchaeota archaeon]|nr:MAG: hypothetical protein D6783_00210 [Candidatus Woesearchaeota archaeon]